MPRYIRPIACLMAVALLAGSSAAADPDALAKALQEKAPKVIAHLKKKGYQNVGVLKFLVSKGELPAANAPIAPVGSDNVGDLNLSLANKTEVALILANPDDTFGIISQASQAVVDQHMSAANHKEAAGRKEFFTRKFALAWSGDKVDPSAFLTGEAAISTDLKTLAVRLRVFDKTGAIEDIPDDISVAANAKTIAEAGFSYAFSKPVQKVLVSGEPVPAKEEQNKEAIEQAKQSLKVPEKAEPFAPLANSPVKWTILYNDKPVEVKGNKVPEPKETDKVEFLLENPGPGTYAVVLLVNGENTLYREKTAIDGCRKWVLAPNTSVTIRGFQTDRDTVSQFKVLTPEESDDESVNYGAHSGTFRMVAYNGNITEKPAGRDIPLDDTDSTTVAIARTRGTATPPGVKSQSLKALQADLRGRYRSGDGSRGLIVKSDKEESFETQAVQFVPTAEVPVADVTLRYYTPKR